MKIIVLGKEKQESRIYGKTFDLLNCRPLYLQPDICNYREELEADVVLVSREWVCSERLAICAFLKRKIPVIYVMDGIIEWSYVWNNQSYVFPDKGTVLQPLLANVLCVIGRHPARILSAMGLAERIHITGLARFDDFKKERILESGTKPRIVITTAKTYGHNMEQQIFVRNALQDLKEYFEAQTHLDAIWRISEELGDYLGIKVSSEGSLYGILQRSSALISFPSTCLLEGMALGLPTALIEYRPVPLYVQTAWEIRCKEHIPMVIRELLYPPPEKLAYQDICLEDELAVHQKASEELARVIREQIEQRNSGYQPPTQSDLSYGKLDYHQIHSHLSAFSILPVSRLQYELDATHRYLNLLEKLYRHPMMQLFFKLSRFFRFLPGFRGIARILNEFKSF